MGKFCSNCGMQVGENAKFCMSCGTKIAGAPPHAQQTQQQPYAPPPQQPIYQQQYQQPYAQQSQQQTQGGTPMFTDKQTVLAQAPNALNRPDQPWAVTIEGDAIVARWKWMDATFFAPHEVTNETKDYSFTVILDDKGKWKEVDRTEQKSAGVNMSGGKVGFGASSQKFIGKTSQKSFSFGTGVNNQTGEAGLIKFKFDTSLVKKPIRAYLESCGWKKPGLFG